MNTNNDLILEITNEFEKVVWKVLRTDETVKRIQLETIMPPTGAKKDMEDRKVKTKKKEDNLKLVDDMVEEKINTTAQNSIINVVGHSNLTNIDDLLDLIG